MKVLLIPDKFKGSLSAKGVIEALKRGIGASIKSAEFFSVLASDGGDGFLNSIAENVSCQKVILDTVDPLGRKYKSYYLFDQTEGIAYIELAKASGLELLLVAERNAMNTSSFGTGLEIKDAIEKGASKIYVGLGGSATNDGGIGIANALGYTFLDKRGQKLKPIGKNLSLIHSLTRNSQILPTNVSVFAVNDVDNPLYGINGAAYTYAAQKGADSKEIETLDQGLKHLSKIVMDSLNIDCAQIPGSGAAGGAAYGLKAFLGANYISGIEFVLNLYKVEKLLQEVKFDYIVTGEGKFDNQTLNGKLIKGVSDLGKRYNIPVLAVCGQLAISKEKIKNMGLKEVLEVRDVNKSLQYNMEHAPQLIEQAVATFFLK